MSAPRRRHSFVGPAPAKPLTWQAAGVKVNMFGAGEFLGSDLLDRLLHWIEGIAVACQQAELEQLVEKFRQCCRIRITKFERATARIYDKKLPLKKLTQLYLVSV